VPSTPSWPISLKPAPAVLTTALLLFSRNILLAADESKSLDDTAFASMPKSMASLAAEFASFSDFPFLSISSLTDSRDCKPASTASSTLLNLPAATADFVIKPNALTNPPPAISEGPSSSAKLMAPKGFLTAVFNTS
jgi:hypothetical protein